MNIYKLAVLSQGACNLQGLINSLPTIIDEIRKEPGYNGTEYINRHPVMVLFAEQIYHLTGCGENWTEAYNKCLDREWLES